MENIFLIIKKWMIIMPKKSTIDEIRARFDADVERFSNLATGQISTVDAPLAMELISCAAAVSTNPISNILDIGCGAGNNTIKLLEYAPNVNCDLLEKICLSGQNKG